MLKAKKLHFGLLMVLLLGLGLGLYFGSIGVVPVSAQVYIESVEYPYYCTGNVSGGIHPFWGGYVNAPAPWPHPDYNATYQPEGFTFNFSQPYFKCDNITEIFDPITGGPTGILYKDNTTLCPNGIITMNITNNLGYNITIIDLTAEVTDSNITLDYRHKFVPDPGGDPRGKLFAGMSSLGVDPIDPYVDDLLQGYIEAPPRAYSNDLDEHYKNFTGATGPEPGKYSDVYGPTSLRQVSDADGADNPTIPKGDTTLLPPEPLAAGETYTEYFGVFWGGNATQGAELYGTITLTLTYEWVPVGAPDASFTYTPIDPIFNETVTFDASASYDPDGNLTDPDSYVWDFGDETTGTGKTVNHTYTTMGDYTVVLNVTDSEGKWATESKPITVIPEFPSLIILPLFMIATLLAVIAYRRKHSM